MGLSVVGIGPDSLLVPFQGYREPLGEMKIGPTAPELIVIRAQIIGRFSMLGSAFTGNVRWWRRVNTSTVLMPADTDLPARARESLTRLPSFDLDGKGMPGEDAIEAY